MEMRMGGTIEVNLPDIDVLRTFNRIQITFKDDETGEYCTVESWLDK